MMSDAHTLRRFPYAGWAWPHDSRDQLLKAALLPNTEAALAALTHWLSTHDLDDMGFHDHRLLAAISERHARSIAAWPQAPRLKGLQRQLWTQSRMRIHAIAPILQAMRDAHIDIMLLKGAARIALRPEAQRQRAHQDVDILVPPAQMQAAAQVLSTHGWQTARGDSALAAIARAPGARAINFQMLPWGDIDLHRTAWHGSRTIQELDTLLWARAKPADYFGVRVCVPEAAERLAMTLSHGAWSPESHSDWLIDAADILAHDDIDWAHFQRVVASRGLNSQMRIGLSYLNQAIGLPLPEDIARELHKPCRPTTLLIAKAPEHIAPGLRPLRHLSYLMGRRQRDKIVGQHIPPLKLAIARPCKESMSIPAMRQQTLLGNGQNLPTGVYHFHATLVLPTPQCKRRIELELNTETENLARFRIYAQPGDSGHIRARIAATVHLTHPTANISLHVRPGKLMPQQTTQQDQARYAALPFHVLSHQLIKPQ